MNPERTDRDGMTIITVEAELDVYTAETLRVTLADLAGEGVTRLVIDLEKCEFIDSTGLGVLLGCHKRMVKRGGALAVVCTVERLLQAIRLTGLHTVLDIYATADAAVKALADKEAGQ